MSIAEGKYVVCINCAHVMGAVEHNALRVAVDCPTCGAKEQFGHGIYIDEFTGYSMAHVRKYREHCDKRGWVRKDAR